MYLQFRVKTKRQQKYLFVVIFLLNVESQFSEALLVRFDLFFALFLSVLCDALVSQGSGFGAGAAEFGFGGGFRRLRHWTRVGRSLETRRSSCS